MNTYRIRTRVITESIYVYEVQSPDAATARTTFNVADLDFEDADLEESVDSEKILTITKVS